MARSVMGFTLAAAAVLLVGSGRPARAAGGGGRISGTVTATGLSSNANAVVYVEHVPGTFKPSQVEMDQKGKEFVPHVLPILNGATVRFLNSDPFDHNVFSPDHEKFDLGTWGQGQSKDYTFDKCSKFPCAYTLLCSIHPEMEGFIVVLRNPYFAQTDAEGRYVIRNVPPGTYTLGVWHPKLKGASKSVTVGSGVSTVNFTLKS
jgi:plastocyanin